MAQGGPGVVYVNLDEFAGQARPGAGRGDAHAGVLRGYPNVMSRSFAPLQGNSGNLARQVRPGAGRGEGIVAALGDPNPGAQSGAVDTLAIRLQRLLPVAGIVASSVAVTGLAVGTAPPAAGFGFFVLLLWGLSLVTVHVLRA